MCSHVCSVNADIPDLKYGDIVHFREGDYMYAFHCWRIEACAKSSTALVEFPSNNQQDKRFVDFLFPCHELYTCLGSSYPRDELIVTYDGKTENFPFDTVTKDAIKSAKKKGVFGK